jgi:hypothetical protein
MDNDKIKIIYQKAKIHFLYIIGILVAIIICLIVSTFGNNTELVGYVSFASTIASIFLAVISIIYAFYSNSQLSQTLGQVESASKNIEKVSDSLSLTTKELDKKTENIPHSIQQLDNKMNYLLENNFSNTNKYNGAEVIPSEQIDHFFEYSSMMGLLALYAVCLSYKTNKRFYIEDLAKKTSILVPEYSFGFLVACSSCGFFSIKDVADDWGIYNVNEEISEKIEQKINNRIDRFKDKDKKNLLLSDKNIIENYFNQLEDKYKHL